MYVDNRICVRNVLHLLRILFSYQIMCMGSNAFLRFLELKLCDLASKQSLRRLFFFLEKATDYLIKNYIIFNW